MLTNPVSSHALARASHTIGIAEAESTVFDALDEAANDATGESQPGGKNS
jgi:multisubunit Na+/H+ antiporter MnhG subunit